MLILNSLQLSHAIVFKVILPSRLCNSGNSEGYSKQKGMFCFWLNAQGMAMADFKDDPLSSFCRVLYLYQAYWLLPISRNSGRWA